MKDQLETKEKLIKMLSDNQSEVSPSSMEVGQVSCSSETSYVKQVSWDTPSKVYEVNILVLYNAHNLILFVKVSQLYSKSARL